ncbi:VOC family protein [Streptomyces sp. NBC_01795]|uniref:VOC family protein n=1 Tax=unclassified Streptomyces TaxID=2593676 RepID=UPI002DDBA3E8|nr:MULTISPECIES: VOC family protein [unclassified Streptomyces]WSA94347.1 VOC family protein [Streptomyces sp. NBC_01795]WSB78765.1 VOC family protein [Streptomyces sp. NBC_01775]
MAIAKMGVVVLDCPDPKSLAEFYAAVLGWKVEESEDEQDWVEVLSPDSGRQLAFQESPGYIPPQWPSLEHGQQFHLDFDVPKAGIEEAEREVLALGARLVQGDGDGARGFRVYLDPVGHPFCLCMTDR